MGLGKAEPVAVTGALVGAIFGVLRADMVGVISSSLASEVRKGVNAGRFPPPLAGSGNAMASIVCSSSDSNRDVCSFKADPAGRPTAFRIFISDAGVAGLSLIRGMGADWNPGFATICGDLLAEADLGVEGGGIRISERGSGDIDSASELSWPIPTESMPPVCCIAFVERLAFSASSTIPDTLLLGILVFEECFFFGCGFIAGDCRTDRDGAR